jgi:hypothetical protein
MRQLAAFLCAGVLGAATAFAQGPPTPDSGPFPLPAPAASIEPGIDHPPTVAESCGCLYAEVDSLLRWFKPVCASVPVVAIGNPQASVPGALGQPGTQVVIGGSPPHKFEFPPTPGAQVTLGWDRGDGAVGLKISGFLMEQAANGQHFTAFPNGSPNTYLPYQAPDNSFQALPFTVPGLVTGGSVAVGSTKVWGVESDLTMPFPVDRGAHAFYGTFLVGGRYLDLTDRVRITNALRRVADPSAFALGADQFSTHNQFAGPQVGTELGLGWGSWSVELTNKLAAGLTRQLRNIEGSPLLTASEVSPQLVPGPLLALPSNVSRETARRVTLVPEIGIHSRLALTPWCSVSLGYTLLYWNKILCPGDQMSPLSNVTQVPFHGPVAGSLDPKPLFLHTDCFAQGLDFGIQFRY